MIGQRLAHYTIVDKIGAGGMGDVYRARDEQLDRDVAIKVLPVACSRNVARIRRFEREARTLAALNHPNIATVFGFHEDKGVHLLAMELVDGQTLSTAIPEGGLPLDRLLAIGIPLAEAIAFAHERGVIHRDLKPANVMLDGSGRLRVLDFGVAALRTTDSEGEPEATIEVLTREDEVVGTVAYMAPEQLEGRPVDARADVFALGVLLYELATGHRPFRANSAAGVAAAILRDEPASLLDLRPDLPGDLARVLRRCLEKRVDRRLQTVLDLRNELDDLRSGRRTKGSPSEPPPDAPGPLTEGHMTITTEHVRSLSARIPRMVGDAMTYLDNNRSSDVLVTYVSGIGCDQRDFEPLLSELPHRAAALSLYGIGPTARMRPPLPFLDHNRLLAFLIQEVRRRVSPETFILVGHSSGADQLLHILASTDGEPCRPDGLILLGPMVRPMTGSAVSTVFAQMSDDPGGILHAIRTVAGDAEDLDTWLTRHDYLLRAFGKFGTDVAALRAFAQGYLASYDEDTFFDLFRSTLASVPNVRCVFAEEERPDADFALERHISCDALGERFVEEMIVPDATKRHMDLKSLDVLRPQILEVMKRATR